MHCISKCFGTSSTFDANTTDVLRCKVRLYESDSLLTERKVINVATQHYSYKNISANKGQNIIASSAYNSRKKKYDEAEKSMKYPHAKKDDHVGETMVMTPSGTPEEWLNPERLWNEAKKVDPVRQGKNLIIALPHELVYIKKPGSTDNKDYDIRICVNMIKEHCQKEFVDKGHACQIDFHLSFNKKTGKPNLHAHVLVTERQIVNGKWAEAKSKKIYLDENNNIIQPIESPELHFGRLKYNPDGTVKMTLGYTKLQYDKDGKPLLNENGYPVLTDIRVPAIDPTTGLQATSKNGKNQKPEWKSRKQYADDLDAKDHVNVLRQNWYDLQNQYFKEYKLRYKSGKQYQVDYRPFKEKFKNLRPELQPRPTKHVGYGAKKPSITEYNNAVIEERNLQRQYKSKIIEYKKRKQVSEAKTNENNIITLNEKRKYYETYNPRNLFIDFWVRNYNALLNTVTAKDKKLVARLLNAIRYNRDNLFIDTQSLKGQAKLRKAERFNESMKYIQNSIYNFHNHTDLNEITSAAGKKYDSLTNQEIVKFVKETCKDNAAKIVGEILNLDRNDGTDALDIGNTRTPDYPKNNKNEELLKAACKYFFQKENYQEIEDSIYNLWNKTPEEAPPESIAKLVNMYHTAIGYYTDALNNNEWTERLTITDYHPETINQDYINEIEEINRQEARLKAAEEKHKADELAEQKRKELELAAARKAQAETAARESGEKAASVPPNPETMFNDLWGKDPVKATLYLIKQTKIGNMKYNPDHYNAISSKVKSLKARTIEAIISNKGKAFIYKEATDRMYDHYPTPDKVIADYKTDMEKHSQKLETEATEHAPREYQTYKDLGKLLKIYHQLNPELKGKLVEIDYSDVLKRAKERNYDFGL